MCRCLSDEFLCVCRCIKTFEVEFCSDQTEFSRINPQDTIFTSYVHSPGENDSKEQQNWIMFTLFKLHVTLTVCVSCRVVLCRVVLCRVVSCCVVQWTRRSEVSTEFELWTTGDVPGRTRCLRGTQRINRRINIHIRCFIQLEYIF